MLSKAQYIHDHASVDVDRSLPLVDLEQRRVVKSLSQYFEAVRQGASVAPLRDATHMLLSDIDEFLDELQALHPARGAEDRNTLRNRQTLLALLEEALGTLCETLTERPATSEVNRFRTSIREGTDAVLLSLVDALESDDRMNWHMAKQLTADRRKMMRQVRTDYLEIDTPRQKQDLIDVLQITNAVEDACFILSSMEREFSEYPLSGARAQP